MHPWRANQVVLLDSKQMLSKGGNKYSNIFWTHGQISLKIRYLIVGELIQVKQTLNGEKLQTRLMG